MVSQPHTSSKPGTTIIMWLVRLVSIWPIQQPYSTVATIMSPSLYANHRIHATAATSLYENQALVSICYKLLLLCKYIEEEVSTSK